jgi:2'-5' RNA ligase
MPKFSTTQFELPESLAAKVRKFAGAIPDDELTDNGREVVTHITIKYGLHTSNSEDVRKVLKDIDPVFVMFGNVSIFAAEDTGGEFDVVKVDVVKSPALLELNALLGKELENTTTQKEYVPHITIAYVKPGEGEKYIGNKFLSGESFEFNSLVFSSSKGKRTSIYLTPGQESKSLAGENMDELILFGDAVKALGNGKVGGYLVRFTDANKKDLTKQYFSIKSYLGPVNGDGAECLFEHGLSLKEDAIHRGVKDKEVLKMFDELADLTFAPLKTKRDKLGVWAETVLDISDGYQKMVYEMAEKGKLGWSSGSAGHRIKIASDGHITRWPIIEGSLTPRPCMPMDTAVMPMKAYRENYADAIKSFFNIEDEADDDVEIIPPVALKGNSLAFRLSQHIDDLTDEGKDRNTIIKSLAREALCKDEEVEAVLSGVDKRPSDTRLKAFARVLNVDIDQLKEIAGAPSQQTIKGMFVEAAKEQIPSRWQLDDIFRKLICKIATIAKASAATDTEFDAEAKVKEVIAEYGAAMLPLILGQFQEFIESTTEEHFYLKSVSDLSGVFENVEGVAFDEHSRLVVSANTGIIKRFDRYYQNRLKVGRPLSESTRKELIAYNEHILIAASGIQALLDKTQPMVSEDDMGKAKTAMLRQRWAMSQAGVELQ